MDMKNIKINELFSLIAASDVLPRPEDKRSVYDTVREVLRVKKTLKFRNNVDTILKSEELFTYFVENYDAKTSSKHLDNIDKIYDVITGYLKEESESAGEEVISESETEETDSDDTDSEVSDHVVQLEYKINCCNDKMESRVKKEHERTRWLIGSGVVLGFGNLAITVLLALRVLDLYKCSCV